MGGVAHRAALRGRHPARLTVPQRRMGLVLSQPARDLLPRDSIQLPSLTAAVALAGAVAAPLAALFWLCGGVSLLWAFAAMALTALVVLYTGFLVLRVVNGAEMSPAAAWVCGIFATSLGLYALVQWLELSATSAAVVWALGVGGLVWRPRSGRARLDVPVLPVLQL